MNMNLQSKNSKEAGVGMVFSNKAKTLGRLLILMTFSMNLVGCQTYNSSFACPDAKGAKCVSMDQVDMMIDSGEIERFSGVNKCVGKECAGMSVIKDSDSSMDGVMRDDIGENNSTDYF